MGKKKNGEIGDKCLYGYKKGFCTTINYFGGEHKINLGFPSQEHLFNQSAGWETKLIKSFPDKSTYKQYTYRCWPKV